MAGESNRKMFVLEELIVFAVGDSPSLAFCGATETLVSISLVI
jgi:hypothetical protein